MFAALRVLRLNIHWVFYFAIQNIAQQCIEGPFKRLLSTATANKDLPLNLYLSAAPSFEITYFTVI